MAKINTAACKAAIVNYLLNDKDGKLDARSIGVQATLRAIDSRSEDPQDLEDLPPENEPEVQKIINVLTNESSWARLEKVKDSSGVERVFQIKDSVIDRFPGYCLEDISARVQSEGDNITDIDVDMD